jgi:hypothetical protein
MQRMALGQGCISLQPRGYEDVAAYCIDQSREPPREHAILSSVSALAAGPAARAPGGAGLPLEEAMARGIVRLEGLGSRAQLRIRNLTAAAVEICIPGPTIAMGNGERAIGDLDKIRGRLAELLAAPAETAAAHERVQQSLWEAVNAADGADAETAIGAIPLRPAPSPAKAPVANAPVTKEKCAKDAARAMLCVE